MSDTPKILIIDDEEIVRDSCIHILARDDYQITTAKNGEEGVALLEEIQPDLLLVDLKMPGISGFEVLEKVRNYDPTIVSIVITGFATIDSAVESMKKGTFDFLPKPFKPDELRIIVRRGLERRRLLLETIALRKEKELLREHFAAIVSHELKSPLGAVQQNLFVLASNLADVLSDDQTDKLERLKARVSDLIKLINTWLRVISVDINNIREDFETVSLDVVISKAIESVQTQAVRKDINITVVQEESGFVHGDEGTLVESIVNLLSNGIKYSRPGKNIMIETEKLDSEIEIRVIDQGVGIEKEDIPHIFDDFYTGNIKPDSGRSSGVGLAITRRIIEAHDGTISVESTLGEGSVFTIHLPALQE